MARILQAINRSALTNTRWWNEYTLAVAQSQKKYENLSILADDLRQRNDQLAIRVAETRAASKQPDNTALYIADVEAKTVDLWETLFQNSVKAELRNQARADESVTGSANARRLEAMTPEQVVAEVNANAQSYGNDPGVRLRLKADAMRPGAENDSPETKRMRDAYLARTELNLNEDQRKAEAAFASRLATLKKTQLEAAKKREAAYSPYAAADPVRGAAARARLDGDETTYADAQAIVGVKTAMELYNLSLLDLADDGELNFSVPALANIPPEKRQTVIQAFTDVYKDVDANDAYKRADAYLHDPAFLNGQRELMEMKRKEAVVREQMASYSDPYRRAQADTFKKRYGVDINDVDAWWATKSEQEYALRSAGRKIFTDAESAIPTPKTQLEIEVARFIQENPDTWNREKLLRTLKNKGFTGKEITQATALAHAYDIAQESKVALPDVSKSPQMRGSITKKSGQLEVAIAVKEIVQREWHQAGKKAKEVRALLRRDKLPVPEELKKLDDSATAGAPVPRGTFASRLGIGSHVREAVATRNVPFLIWLHKSAPDRRSQEMVKKEIQIESRKANAPEMLQVVDPTVKNKLQEFSKKAKEEKPGVLQEALDMFPSEATGDVKPPVLPPEPAPIVEPPPVTPPPAAPVTKPKSAAPAKKPVPTAVKSSTSTTPTPVKAPVAELTDVQKKQKAYDVLNQQLDVLKQQMLAEDDDIKNAQLEEQYTNLKKARDALKEGSK